MIEVYRGSPNTWECDEMGHMNVRFYLARFNESLGIFAHKTKMAHAFRANSPSTISPKDIHLRFVKECLAGKPIYIEAGVLDVQDTSALVYFKMSHLNGDVAATCQMWLHHRDNHTMKTFAWSPRTRAAFEDIRHTGEIEFGPRSIDFSITPDRPPTMADVTEIEPRLIGCGLVPPQHCDVYGFMNPEHIIGRISDSVPNLLDSAGETMSRGPSEGGNAGTAALEYRVIVDDLPEAGDTFNLYSGVVGAMGKVIAIRHWLMNPTTGTAFARIQATVVQFDLETRKAVAPDAKGIETLKASAPHPLWL